MTINWNNVGAMADICRTLGHSLENLRKARGLTQNDLAKLAKVPRTTLSHIESGAGNPSLRIVATLAIALGVTIEELLQPTQTSCVLVKNQDLARPMGDRGDVVKVSLLPKPVPGVQWERLDFKPHGLLPGAPHVKGTREYFACMTGQLLVIVEGEEYSLSAGDVLAFPGDCRHFYKNLDTTNSVGVSLVALNYDE